MNKTTGLSWRRQRWETSNDGRSVCGVKRRTHCRKPWFLFQTCFSPSVPSQKSGPVAYPTAPARNFQVLPAHPFFLSPSTQVQFCPCSHRENRTVSRPGQCPSEGLHPGSLAVGLVQQLPASLGRKWRVGFSHREAPADLDDEGRRERELGSLRENNQDGRPWTPRW